MMPAEIQAPRIVAISTSDSPDMDALGLSECHLREAVAEFAIHLLASGANLAYGGDLRQQSFTELLFELVMRYRQQEETEARVTDYLAWPVHIRMTVDDLDKHNAKLLEFAQLVLIGQDGSRMSMEDRQMLPSREPTDSEWSAGLTSMRQAMCRETGARIVLGGRVEGYKGDMPGIAEEALLSFRAGQPLFLVGGFGGCTRDIAEAVRTRRYPIRLPPGLAGAPSVRTLWAERFAQWTLHRREPGSRTHIAYRAGRVLGYARTSSVAR